MGEVVDIKHKRRKVKKPEALAKLQFTGHSTVIITTESGKRAVIDPFLEGNPKCPDELKTLTGIDYIFLTHGHADHASGAAGLAKATGAKIYATYELAMLMVKEGVPQAQVQPMNKGGSIRIPNSNGLIINLTNAFHSSSFDASDGVTYYAGEACGVVLELESGRTIYHAGDTCLFQDMELIGDQFEPEVALLPIGDCFTMGPEDAAHAVELVEPKIVIPIHYGTFEALSGTPDMFSQQLRQLNTELVVLEPGGIYEF